MITLSMFQAHLSSIEPLPPSSDQSMNGQERYLLKLLTILPSQTQEQQAAHLESVLSSLYTANIDEPQRLKLMATVVDASDRLIATFRQHYIYEAGALSEAQLKHVAQIKSLHYLIIMVYDRVIRRQIFASTNSSKSSLGKSWQRYFSNDKKPSSLLAIAIYQSLLRYQKILGEDALCYKNSSSYLWQNINQLYYLARQQQIADINLSVYTVTAHANSIHRLYCQICLHHLLNLRAMRRPNILLVQRLVFEWAEYVTASMEPTTETRVFVDLHSDKPPSYLTASSNINPYEDRHDCLFIELTPLVQYFDSREQAFIDEGSIGIEYGLLNTISMTLSYRYLQPSSMSPTKYSTVHTARLMTGFNNIHYHVGHSQSFAKIIAINNLQEDVRPLYNRFNKDAESHRVLTVERFDDEEHVSLYRRCRLLSDSDVSNSTTLDSHALNENNSSTKTSSTKNSLNKNSPKADTAIANLYTSVPKPLHIMSLILVHDIDNAKRSHDTVGVVRWINLDTKKPEIEWQVLGRKLIACGLRLEGSETRTRHFVPAFVVGKDEALQTNSTLIVPSSYFQTNDRVVMRVGNKQTSLRLGRRLLMTDEFNQYEVAQL